MEEILLVVLRVLFAVLWGLFESLPYIPLDFGYDRAIQKVPTFVVLVIYFGIGCAVGGLSLVLLPTAMVTTSSLRVLTLVSSPVFGGLIGMLTTALVHENLAKTDRNKHFWPGFLFALGVSSIRFTYCSR